jgi:hypothetical protein
LCSRGPACWFLRWTRFRAPAAPRKVALPWYRQFWDRLLLLACTWPVRCIFGFRSGTACCFHLDIPSEQALPWKVCDGGGAAELSGRGGPIPDFLPLADSRAYPGGLQRIYRPGPTSVNPLPTEVCQLFLPIRNDQLCVAFSIHRAVSNDASRDRDKMPRRGRGFKLEALGSYAYHQRNGSRSE